MDDPFVAIVVTVPDEYFSDDDDISLKASNFVCHQLESHLVQRGHIIPDWLKGGCDEDWGVYFESLWNETRYQYEIGFWGGPEGDPQQQMIIQYDVLIPFLKRIFRKPVHLSFDDGMHETMRAFGKLFSDSRMLTRDQFEKGY